MPDSRDFNPLVPCLAVAFGVAGIALITGLGWWANSFDAPARPATPYWDRTASAQATGGRFSLVDGDGRGVTQASFPGQWTLIYFGYTFCPDVCPTELSKLAEAMDLLGPEAGPKVQPVFITVDPERDTPAHLKDYVSLFHPRLLGLSGSKEQVSGATRSFRVVAVKRETPGMSGYLMDHSSAFYLVGPDGRFDTQFPGSMTGDELASALRDRLARPMAALTPRGVQPAADICTVDGAPLDASALPARPRT